MDLLKIDISILDIWLERFTNDHLHKSYRDSVTLHWSKKIQCISFPNNPQLLGTHRIVYKPELIDEQY